MEPAVFISLWQKAAPMEDASSTGTPILWESRHLAPSLQKEKALRKVNISLIGGGSSFYKMSRNKSGGLADKLIIQFLFLIVVKRFSYG